MKCWIVDDRNGWGDDQYSGQVIAAESRNQAKSFAWKHWFYDIEYIYLNVRRYPKGDSLAKDKSEPCEICDQDELRSIGFKWTCNDCGVEYLAGDVCRCEAVLNG